MRTFVTLAFLVSCTPKAPPSPAVAPPTAEEAAAFAAEANARLLELWRAQETALWAHETDLTEEKEKAAAAADEAVMAYLSEAIPKAARFDGVQTDPDTARTLMLLKVANPLVAPSDPAKRAELASIATSLSSTYGKGEWCRSEGDCLDIGGIEQILATSRDPAELKAAWEGWHRISVPMREPYGRFVALANEGAREVGFSDTGARWRGGYDMDPAALETEIDRLWTEVKPLYDALHCHVRAKLVEKYGPDVVPPTGPIPAHLLGNLWAQDWANLYPELEPFPGQPSIDVTKALESQGRSAEDMTRMAEGFFTSMGLDPLPQTFWERSMFVQPPDRDVVCHASAWDPSWSDDLRIKMCIKPNMDDLVTLHHELGHLYYFHYYKDLPALYRQGANDGFHEAIGDAIALSMTPGYLNQIGLLTEASADEKAVINAQMQVALQRIAFLPFGLVVDRWRWEVFDGRIPEDGYNAGWWRLKNELQGVAPPSERTEEAFDPGAKYHVPGNTPYLRYFLAHVLEFQLLQGMCDAAGHEGPLHTCSIYGSTAAGDRLKAMLELGASKPWPDALEVATGSREMDGGAIVTYFDPLMKWLEQQNQGRTCGW